MTELLILKTAAGETTSESCFAQPRSILAPQNSSARAIHKHLGLLTDGEAVVLFGRLYLPILRTEAPNRLRKWRHPPW